VQGCAAPSGEVAPDGLARHGIAAAVLPRSCPDPFGRLRARDWYPAKRHGLSDRA